MSARFLGITQIFKNFQRHRIAGAGVDSARQQRRVEQPERKARAQAGELFETELFMSDLYVGHLSPPPTPRCPVCGGETHLADDIHKAVAKATNVFRCTRCHVEYPVARKPEA